MNRLVQTGKPYATGVQQVEWSAAGTGPTDVPKPHRAITGILVAAALGAAIQGVILYFLL